MQERDEGLARAYVEIGRLEKKSLRLIIAVIILAAALAATAVVNIFFRR
jgi:type IV secretory pathway component VirB8